MKSIGHQVMLCVNNPDNGMPTRYVHALEICGGQFTAWRNIKWGVKDRRMLNIGRLRVPIISFTDWVGNWCWSCALVSGPVAGRILRWIFDHRDDWCCVEAPCAMYEKFNRRGSLK